MALPIILNITDASSEDRGKRPIEIPCVTEGTKKSAAITFRANRKKKFKYKADCYNPKTDYKNNIIK